MNLPSSCLSCISSKNASLFVGIPAFFKFNTCHKEKHGLLRSKSPIFLSTENMRIAIRIASFAALLCCQRKTGLSFKQHYTI